MREISVRPGERIDDTGFDGIRVIQTDEFGYGVDAVLLASFAAGETGARPIRKGSSVADLGTGCGIVAFIISHKISGTIVTGWEKQQDAADRASRACIMNGLEDRVTIKCRDIKEISNEMAGADNECICDAVVSNPPYFRRGGAIPSSADSRFIARHETTADIGDFAATASSMLRRGGSFYLVHRPDRLADIFQAMRNAGIEPKELQLVVPRDGDAPNIVLIHGVKGAGAELKVLPVIAVRGSDGGFTPLINDIYERTVYCQ